MNAFASPPRVGFIGLGVMGRPMASHLARAGHPLQLFDDVPGVSAELARKATPQAYGASGHAMKPTAGAMKPLTLSRVL